MSAVPAPGSSPLKLPDRPSLDHLKKQAYDLHRELCAQRGDEVPLADAYHELAKRYGFASWPKLKRHVEYYGDADAQDIIRSIDSGDVERLRDLLRRRPDLVVAREPNGYSLLHVICGGENHSNPRRAEVIEAILDAGLPADAALDSGETALHFAATYHDTVRVETLLRRGARIDVMAAGDGGTPLVHALSYGCDANAEQLAAKRILPMNLRVAAGLGRLDLIDLFVDTRGNLLPGAGDHRQFYRCHDGLPGWTITDDPVQILGEALLYASQNGRRDAVELLLDRGVDPNFRGPAQVTAIHSAAYRGSRPVIELLLARGADVDVRETHYNGYPWGWAAVAGHADIQRLVLSRSRTLDIFQACHFDVGVQRVREMLDRDPSLIHARQGDPPSCGRHRGGAALHEAVDWWKPDIAALLIERGADVNARTEEGLTPLAIAIEKQNAEAIALLRRHGAGV